MKITALAGGVGGAKLADGLARRQPGIDFSVVVNTGDDFQHFGLYISPDLDTVCYNLAGIQHPERGWGRDQESWETLAELRRLGGPDWFQLGDKDLAIHLERTRRMQSGQTLSEITADLCASWEIPVQVLPMTDDRVATRVHTAGGELAFQDYFVRQACQPEVTGFHFEGVETARPAPGVLEALQGADLIVICPSNPWVSIDPILALPGVKEQLRDRPTVAVSPLISGQAVKGPAAKMYRELGIDPSAAAVARHYDQLLDGFLIDEQDADLIPEITRASEGCLLVKAVDTWMKNREDRLRLAEDVIVFFEEILEEV